MLFAHAGTRMQHLRFLYDSAFRSCSLVQMSMRMRGERQGFTLRRKTLKRGLKTLEAWVKTF
eukprot:4815874-Pleurochrysis_carterae.AAC.1